MAPSTSTGAGIPTLIDCWRVRDLQRFRAVLKGGPQAAGLTAQQHSQLTSYSKSPTRSHGGSSWTSNGPGPASPAEVNAKDALGRTALALIASSDEGISIDFLLALLSHPSCNVNSQDAESGWTALHRALYAGRLNHALTLLRHTHIDIRVKDLEGLTAFDVYNSTVAGTNPHDTRGDLSLWGSNRNYTLGLGDGNDRALPDSVSLIRPEMELQSAYSLPAGRKYERPQVREVQMSRFHTIVLTDEKSGGNVWVAGIGSNGRLGRSSSTQPTLVPLSDFKETATSLAVGLDHTLIVTDKGAIYSFGLNKWGVLGYVIEEGLGLVGHSGSTGAGGAASATFGNATTSNGKTLDAQITPRKIVGPLKKDVVLGAAVSKLHSVAFTADSLYTWGQNTGQLGYDKAATPLQMIPRKVTSLNASQGIRQVSCTDHATALLLNSLDVLVLHGDLSFKMTFPMARFNLKMSAGVFRPPQAEPKPSIAKLTSSGNTFAALSDYGDLFTFSLDHPSEYAGSTASGRKAPVPETVWSVRKKFTAVRDVAIGLDGSIILCTSSGHVFVRSRRSAGDMSSAKSSKSGAARAFKFAQVPSLQRVIKVATNENGSFAAIRGRPPIKEVKIKGHTLEEHLASLLPHLRANSGADGSGSDASGQITTEISLPEEVDADRKQIDLAGPESDEEESSEADDSVIARHEKMAKLLAESSRRWERGEGTAQYGPSNLRPPSGCDMFLIANGKYLPAHRALLAARLPKLAALLKNPPTKGSGGAPNGILVKKVNEEVVTLTLPGCNLHTAVFLLHYLYTDDLPSIWTTSVGLRVAAELTAAKINRNLVQSQLKELASILGLPALTPVLNSPVSRSPTPTLRQDMASHFESSVTVEPDQSVLHDLELLLSDRTVPAHSHILRRSPFFAALLQPEWSDSRWDSGKLRIDLRHLRWEILSLPLRHLYTNGGCELFEGADGQRSHDEWLDFLTEVLAVSNELLLDHFKLVCSSLLRARIAPQTISAILSIADTFHAQPLKEAGLLYCAQNLEALLEAGVLEELEHKLVSELSTFIKARQDEKMHRSWYTEEVHRLMLKNQAWLDEQDFPPPSLNLASHRTGKRPPRAIPLESGRSSSPLRSPELAPTSAADQVFDFDDDFEKSPSLSAMANLCLDQPSPLGLPKSAGPSSSAPWLSARKSSGRQTPTSASVAPAAGSDFRSIMAAEQARTATPNRLYVAPRGPSSASGPATPAASGTATPIRPSPAAPSGSYESAADVTPLTVQMKLSQKERKRQQQQQLAQQEATVSSSRDSAVPAAAETKASPWKLPDTPKASPMPLGTPTRTPAMQREPSSSGPSPARGPTFVPTRASEGSSSRPSVGRATSEAWATPSKSSAPTVTSPLAATRPMATPTSTSKRTVSSGPSMLSPPTPMTFAEIQAQQHSAEQLALQQSTQRKSFAEIQLEERLEEEKLRKEEEERVAFEKWFEEESRRQRQQQGGGAAAMGGSKKGAGAGKGKKGKKSEGPATGETSGSTAQPAKPATEAVPTGPSNKAKQNKSAIPTGPSARSAAANGRDGRAPSNAPRGPSNKKAPATTAASNGPPVQTNGEVPSRRPSKQRAPATAAAPPAAPGFSATTPSFRPSATPFQPSANAGP